MTSLEQYLEEERFHKILNGKLAFGGTRTISNSEYLEYIRLFTAGINAGYSNESNSSGHLEASVSDEVYGLGYEIGELGRKASLKELHILNFTEIFIGYIISFRNPSAAAAYQRNNNTSEKLKQLKDRLR